MDSLPNFLIHGTPLRARERAPLKSTCWIDYVSRIDHFIWKHCQCVEQRWKTILHHLTKLHAFIGNVANALRIIEKRYNAL